MPRKLAVPSEAKPKGRSLQDALNVQQPTETDMLAVKEFTPKKVETKPLTKDLAEWMQAIPRVKNERELKTSHVEYLNNEAVNRQLVTFQWAVAKLGDRTIRLNGQHSSKMLVDLYNSNITADFRAYLDRQQVSLSEYEIKEERDLVPLFRKFDPPQSTRTKKDVSAIYQKSNEHLLKLDTERAKRSVDAIAWYNKTVLKQKVSEDEKYGYYYEDKFLPFLTWIDGLNWEKMGEFKKLPVIGAMYATFTLSLEDAKKFWVEVTKGGDVGNEDDPAKVLEDWLLDTKKVSSKIKPAEFYQGCISAWNAYRTNKGLKDIKYQIGPKGFHDPV